MDSLQQAWNETRGLSGVLNEYSLLLQRFDELTGLGDQGGKKYYGDRVFRFHLAAIQNGIDSRRALQTVIAAVKYDIESRP